MRILTAMAAPAMWQWPRALFEACPGRDQRNHAVVQHPTLPERGRTVLGVLFLSGFAVASANAAPPADAPPSAATTDHARSDADLEALLQVVERQVSNGRVVSPAGDNALETWKDVIGMAF